MAAGDRGVGGRWLAVAGLAAAALLAGVWSNHFENAFQFDDAHSIVGNPWIRSLANVPRFFGDATTFSTLPANQSWRPLLSTTYAVDYWLGGGLKPFWFHLDSFVWFVGMAVLLFVMFRGVLRDAAPGAAEVLALFGAALFGVHAANAETVNYISARSDLLSTFFLLLAFWLFVARPELRPRGLYLAPYVLAALVKPVVLVFPILVAAWVWIFETRPGAGRVRATGAAAMPALATTLCLAAVHAAMTPRRFTPGGSRWGGQRLGRVALAGRSPRAGGAPVSCRDAGGNRLAAAATGDPPGSVRADLVPGHAGTHLERVPARRGRERAPDVPAVRWVVPGLPRRVGDRVVEGPGPA
jgi:hypothetical protein